MPSTPRPLIGTFAQLLERASNLSPQRILVILPANAETFAAIGAAQKQFKAKFVLVGDRKTIEEGLPAHGGNSSGIELHHAENPAEALRQSMAIAASGSADVLIKGGIDTGRMMKAVLQEESGLRTGRLLSDVFVLEYAPRSGFRFVMITDGGLNLAPGLKEKAEIVANAVDVAHALGNTMPKVAILSATEFVNPALQSTIDAAALSKMNERGQIVGCAVDGPLALDNALSPDAAREKKLTGPVAGQAEILVAPTIEAANALAKGTTYFAGLQPAHVIVGAKIPILIPSRADAAEAKLRSIALGMIMADAGGHGGSGQR
jgi:phosphate butyryltransferase